MWPGPCLTRCRSCLRPRWTFTTLSKVLSGQLVERLRWVYPVIYIFSYTLFDTVIPFESLKALILHKSLSLSFRSLSTWCPSLKTLAARPLSMPLWRGYCSRTGEPWEWPSEVKTCVPHISYRQSAFWRPHNTCSHHHWFKVPSYKSMSRKWNQVTAFKWDGATYVVYTYLLWAGLTVFYAFIILDGTKEELGLNHATKWQFEHQEVYVRRSLDL